MKKLVSANQIKSVAQKIVEDDNSDFIVMKNAFIEDLRIYANEFDELSYRCNKYIKQMSAATNKDQIKPVIRSLGQPGLSNTAMLTGKDFFSNISRLIDKYKNLLK